MDRSDMVAYAEVDCILGLMDESYQNLIPVKLRNLISENKLKGYNVSIDVDRPLEEQEISRKAIAILAFLDYKYWCEDENEKRELIKEYQENDKKEQERLREVYNPDKIFEKKVENVHNSEQIEDKSENKELVVYEDKNNLFKRIIEKIKGMFKRKV